MRTDKIVIGRMDSLCLVIGWVVVGAVGCATATAETRQLVVQAGDCDRALVPMCIDAPAGITDPKLTDAGTGKAVACQIIDGKLWWILDKLPAGQSKTYRVASGGKAKPVVEVRDGENKYDVTIAGKPFTTCWYDPKEIRPYCYPLFGPNQARMTRGYPMVGDIPGERHDHHHHRSFYVAHGEFRDDKDKDKKYNFWHEPRDKEGKPAVDRWDRQILREVVRAEGGPVAGVVEILVDWTAASGKKILEENRRLTIYAIDGPARIADLRVALRAKYEDVHFLDTKEGGICSLRLAPEIREKKGTHGSGGGLITNSNGQATARRAWGKKAKWVDYSRIKGQQYGITVFDTPGNLRYPTRWHVRDYGLFTANPFGILCFDKASGERGDYDLPKGKELVLRYRLYLHAGDVKAAKVAARYEDYVNPPKAMWK